MHEIRFRADAGPSTDVDRQLSAFQGDCRNPCRQDPHVYILETARARGLHLARFEFGLPAGGEEQADTAASAVPALETETVIEGPDASERAELHGPPLLRCGRNGPHQHGGADRDCSA